MPSMKIAQIVQLGQTNGLPELYMKNVFKQHLLMNHWSKFKIITQKCFS